MNVNQDQFLWPKEEKLTYHLIKLQEFAFAWTEDEKGKFSSDYFDLVMIPTVEYIPLKECKRELHTGTNKTMLCQLPIVY